MQEALPVVDFRELERGDERARDAFAQKFGDGLRTYGFGVVAEHPIGRERIARAFELCEQLFSLPEETKRKYVVPSSDGNRGYIPFGGERAVGARVADLKEFFHVGQERPASGSQLWPNAWPTEVPGFREELLSLYRDFEQTARGLLTAIARYLDLPQDHLASMIDGGDSVIRLIHYPSGMDRRDQVHPAAARDRPTEREARGQQLERARVRRVRRQEFEDLDRFPPDPSREPGFLFIESKTDRGLRGTLWGGTAHDHVQGDFVATDCPSEPSWWGGLPK